MGTANMTINLPELRHLSYRWELPTSIIQACDHHFLERLTYPELADLVRIGQGAEIYIEKHGVQFKIVFQNEAELSYAECMKRELQGESCVHKTFWLSYRSMSYKWNGEVKTISVVLVQPARPKVRSGSQELRYMQGKMPVVPVIETVEEASAMRDRYRAAYPTFADRSAQAMESKEGKDE